MKTHLISIAIVIALCNCCAVAQQLGSIVTVSNANYSCSPSNRVVLVTAHTSNVVVTLPQGNASGQELQITVLDGTFNVTVQKNASDVAIVDPTGATFMGGGSCAAGEAVALLSDGNHTWYVIGSRNIGCANWSTNATTGASTLPSASGVGQMLYWGGSKWNTLAAGESGQVLTGSGAASPTWSSPSSGVPTGGIIAFNSSATQSGFTYLGISESKGTESWTNKSSTGFTARHDFACGVVNGIIYCIGGWNGSSSVNKNEAYDPSSNTWSTKSTTGFTPRWSAASAVVNGKIYVIGGTNGGTNVLSTNEVYDPSTDTWSTVSSTGFTARLDGTGAAVNNQIFVIGGSTTTSYTTAAATNEMYDPSTDTWTTKSATGFTARYQLSSAVYNGIIYAFTGQKPGSVNVLANEAYDPSANTWSTKSTTGLTSRATSAAAVLNGKIFVLGGWASSSYLNTNEAYDPSANTWATQLSTGFTARCSQGMATVNGVIYALGGWNGGNLNTNQAYTTPSTFYWFTKN